MARCAVIKAYHDDPVSGGLFGGDKIYQKVAKRYDWSGMKNGIAENVSKCDKCQRQPNKVTLDTTSPASSNRSSRLLASSGKDLVGPLPETGRGHKYICGLSDYFSKCPIAALHKTKSAYKVANVLIGVVCSYGCFETLIIDQGKEFKSRQYSWVWDVSCLYFRLLLDERDVAVCCSGCFEWYHLHCGRVGAKIERWDMLGI